MRYYYNPDYIKAILKKKKVTIGHLIKLWNKSQAAVYARLSGNKILNIDELIDLSNCLGIPIQELLLPEENLKKYY